ncbi:MAG: hypothetical protein K2O28_04180 [Clostridia bacterium]|nr:hypothetical protein [Clostridia bacterium]
MDKTPEEREEIIKAIMEGKVKKDEFLADIFIALKDCIVGKHEQVGNKIIIKLYNGQKFELVLNEV